MPTTHEPIAIIGTGCRFPGDCNNPSKLWELLRHPCDLLKEIPEDRFSVDGFYHPDNSHHGTSNVRHSYFLEDDLRLFDAQFFGIKATEANSVDPQQRLLMETVYESLEAAGLSVQQLQGSDTAVYVGVMSADFTDMIGRDVETFPTYFATGTARSILSNRLSYFFDWHGPSMTIDTACSSSLIAMHQAVQTLRSGQSSVAIVAGSNLILGPEQYIAESKLQMLSPTGRSRMWDAEADGYARGEGVAAVVLKPLSQAIADGDHIECVIRETGVNQDGKTPGITMPSATAQASLIRSTYARAGLDISKPSDRPQFFEAHGTGTPAGDPVEAEAIHNAFFGESANFHPQSPEDKLVVGSIKTVVGHTEGTAGLAAVIKASLALQSGELPPNRLFNELNPKIKPFYRNLQILTTAQKWPRLAERGVRRVSVNSFGFGGANCHAILESADSYKVTEDKSHGTESIGSLSPYLFSAASDNALLSALERMRSYLEAMPSDTSVDLRNLAWTLYTRRTTFSHRTFVTASKSVKELTQKLDESIQTFRQSSDSFLSKTRPSNTPLRILGVFTGQGAQWPRMGAELIEDSPMADRIIQRLNDSLQSLPLQDRPPWSLRDELLAPPESSMVGSPSLSQPLCTAVQIMLVDLLKAAGVQLSAVVGHSSGEMGAAYASGYLSAEDAVRVAYYRGLHLKSVQQKGSMLAVGTSYEDAMELCSLPAFEGRVFVAAVNSSSSVTLSGDSDAIDEVKVILDEEKKFNRILRTSCAYHSPHMQPCAEPYVRSLEQCGIKLQPSRASADCRWVSSVFGCNISDIPSSESIGGSYWASNLTRPVRFTDALSALYQSVQDGDIGTFDMAIEIGPHPALKGPATQTVQECQNGQSIPYTGVLERGKHSTEAISKSLGYIWKTFGEGVIDFAQYDRFVTNTQPSYQMIKGLPTYSWDHSRKFWHESRLSKAFRTRKDPPHELLGRQVLDGTPSHMRWRNILSRKEISWLDGHQVQGQTVFPCAGYVSACVEACMRVCADYGPVQSIELRDFNVGHAMVFNDDAGIDALITLNDINRSEEHGKKTLTAQFAFQSAPKNDTLDMVQHADCQVLVVLGEDIPNLLPPKAPDDSEYALLDVEHDRFYNALGDLGFGYDGPFRSLRKLKRKLGSAQGFIQTPVPITQNQLSPLLIHPATLDCAIQSIMLAFCYPGDSMLRSIYLPTNIRRLVVNPSHCLDFAGKSCHVLFDSTAVVDTAKSLSGDANIYSPQGFNCKAIQLEGLQTRPLSNEGESGDLNIFTELVWNVDKPDSEIIMAQVPVQEPDADLLFSLERVAYFYLRQLGNTFHPSKRDALEWHFKRLLAYVDHVLPRVSRGASRFARKEWANDTEGVITEIYNRYPQNADLRLMRAVGENIIAVVRGETTMLEPMVQDNKLNDFYVHAEGMPQYTAYLAAFASQIGHRYPHMNVLEIGAGTGGATKSFLRELGDQFATYTFTDISSGFFQKASSVFARYSSKMNFRVLDIEADIKTQGFAKGSFDVIIASLVLHATRDLTKTLHNVRELLKPGGYLLLLEITDNEQMRFGLLFGGLPGWWLGYDDGRALSPCIGLTEWERLLKETGFSGIDTAMPHNERLPVPLSVIVSQAVDDRIELLRQPLHHTTQNALIPRLAIVGAGHRSAALALGIQKVLTPHCGDIKIIGSLQQIRENDLNVGGSVLCLSDLDEPIMKSLDQSKLRGFQEIFKQSTNVLWVTSGAREGNPFSRMVVGFGRTIVLEMVHLRLQFLDMNSTAVPEPLRIAEALIRFLTPETWSEKPDSLLHSVEPELSICPNGKVLVPRFKLNKHQNDRYNSKRRTIKHPVDVSKSILELCYSKEGNSYELAELSSDNNVPVWFAEDHLSEIEVNYSMNLSVRTQGDCYLFPISGEHKATGRTVLALSPKLSSRVMIPDSFVLYELNLSTEKQHEILHSFYLTLIGQAALSDISAGAHVILLQAGNRFAQLVDRLATDKAATMMCLSDQLDTKWDYVHPKTPGSAIRNLITLKSPGLETLVLDMGKDSYITTAVAESLPKKDCPIIRKADLVRSTGYLPRKDLRQNIRAALNDFKYALQQQTVAENTAETIEPVPPIHQLEELVSNADVEKRADHEIIVSWRSKLTAVDVPTHSVDTKVRFRSDKTYWLVGLTGGLGLSLCEWMARQGAGHIAITSRSPKVHESFIEKMKLRGVTIEVIAADVCNRDSLRKAHNDITQKLPPIAGVAQGAMVLHDTMFVDLDVERINKVMRPKVEGSMYLEEIFQNTHLEFFVFFSSMACVTGNPGQSAYAAANMFMSGLAAERRRRGLNASAVHIGAIFGNGYVTRELTLAQQQFLKKVGNLWLSEQDFHCLFAEAVYAGQSQRESNAELSTGLMMIEDNEEFQKNITWFRNPMFQHCVRNVQTTQLTENTAKGRHGVQVKAQLQEAVTPDDVRDIIHEAFTLKLQSSLQIDESRPIGDLTADTLGIDSLVAVDIRSWFIKELQVEIPVLNILSGATMGDILARAQELLPKELTPNFNPDGKSSLKLIKTQHKSPATAMTTPSPDVTEIASDRSRGHAKDSAEESAPRLPKTFDNKTAVTRPPVVTQGPQLSFANGSRSPTATSTESGIIFSPADTNSSTTSFGQVDATMADFSESKPGFSPTSWSEIDEHEAESRGSEPIAEPSTMSITTCLEKNDAIIRSTGAVTKRMPISFAQSRFWFLEQFLEAPASALNVTLSIDLDGPLQIGKLERAVLSVGQRHEALRTRFSVENSTAGVMQEVLASSCLALETYDTSTETEEKDWHKLLSQHKYRLSEGENMRIILLKRSSTSFRLIIGYHHINMDGVSLEVVLRELQLIYSSQSPPSIQDIMQYPDFTEQQRLEYQSGKWENDLAFWKKEFGNQAPPVIPLLPLARSQARKPLTSYSSNFADFYISKTVVSSIESTCSRLKLKPFHFHLAIFYTLLTRLLDVEEVCIGTTSANRQLPTTVQSVGMYLNLLPLLFKSQPSQTFASAMQLVRDKSLAAFSHSTVPFDVIVSELGAARTTSHSPMFQVSFNYRPGVSERRNFCDCRSKVAEFNQGQTAYDLTLDVIDNPGDECRIILGGQSALYGNSEMQSLKDMYMNLLNTFSSNPGTRLSTPSLYNIDDIKSSVILGRGAFQQLEWPETLVHRIDNMSERYGDKIAIRDAYGGSLTYSQMTKRVNLISESINRYQANPVKPGTKIGVFLEPSMDWICSLLAILRLGAVYIPLETNLGLDRLSLNVGDCKPDLLLVNAYTKVQAKHFEPLLQPQQMFDIGNASALANENKIPVVAKSSHIAAILYTSGSTGVPKGIVMKHDSFRNNLEIMTSKVFYREGKEVTLQQSSFSFDMSLCQTFLALCNGGTLYVVPRNLRGDPLAISSIIANEGITFTTATPSELISWIQYGDSVSLRNSAWRVAQSGGEPVRPGLLQSFCELDKPDLHLIDCYGPTEITFCCLSRDVDYRGELTSSITGSEAKGLQIWPNYSMYILDANQKPVPAGVSGEVAIGGSGVVSGYLHSELNVNGFRKDTWASQNFVENGWTQFHRTGDIGRLNSADGTLALGSRIAGDAQAKLRGLRIDLCEIETAILKAAEGAISDTAVTIREGKTQGLEYLVAFGVPTTSQATDDFSRILDRLPLPQYMRPAVLMPIEKLPTNSSGKIDRFALKSISLTQIPSLSKKPNNEQLNKVQSQLLELWKQVISPEILSNYSLHADSDFLHVGGSSMLMVQLRAKVEETFKTKVSLFNLFEASTLRGMAALLTEDTSMADPSDGGRSDGKSRESIDWDTETAVPRSLIGMRTSRRSFANPSVVVLTGSTGFLGKALLKRLLEDSIVQKIHCLAIRSDLKSLPKDLFESPKVVLHQGDLGLPHFGLSEETVSKIFSEAHAVIHNGADVSFMKSYATLKPVNVDSTKELVRLSLPNQISFHYISSASVVQLTGQERWDQQSVKEYPPSASNVDGYIATKWACERYLEKISDQCTLPIWIHRPSSISGTEAPTLDLMSNLLRFARRTKAIPDTSAWKGSLDFISVERAAMQIVDEVYEDYSWPGNVRYLYESGEEIFPLANLRDILGRETGSKIEELPMEQWIAQAEAQGMSPLLGDYLRGVSDRSLVFTILEKQETWL
ncbi:hybrid NRPS/NKS cluster containing protein [Colletotrichum truncatum]|uniref:Hybrid NRPS/NKS cluster containing protein n=1 Tax=Colletotrichum truncatum TaxID=5467 RepID=A0ACC3ZBT1_COLTU|nr:hybrid NRPS/NKS cluster containing protein [Colletotrichum truncatum]KAF6783842.1 hybrid NRPS/NKS cluster containing protein [Colletotrichum truncatum]